MYMIVEVSQYVAVASFSEAWIEILWMFPHRDCPIVASFSEAWIEIKISAGVGGNFPGRLLLGGVD